MFKCTFEARPDGQIGDDFRRDDTLAISIAGDAEHNALAALTRDYPDAFLPIGPQRP